jgi:3-oxoacyl-[acyl-carrier protein] reductase
MSGSPNGDRSQELAGKVVLVTGSSRGLGRFYALELARRGADVAIHDVDTSAAARFGEAASGDAVADEIRALGRRSAFFVADLTDSDQTERLIGQVVDGFGQLDVLVNNAGGDIGATTPRPEPNDAIDIDPADIRSVLERNVLTTMFACKYAAAHMRERRTGRIVNIGSVAGHAPARQGIVYAAAKAANSHYTRCLAEELRPFDVNVNCLAPTATYTGRFLATREVGDQGEKSRLQQVAEPADMASIVAFLVGPESARLTGETIVCW